MAWTTQRREFEVIVKCYNRRQEDVLFQILENMIENAVSVNDGYNTRVKTYKIRFLYASNFKSFMYERKSYRFEERFQVINEY